MSKSPITAKGAESLRAQLTELKTVDRPRVIQAIAEARAHGDLSENAEYHAAREQQGFIEGRISAIETALAEAQIIDVAGLDAGGKIVFGATVTLRNPDDAKRKAIYQIVGEEEADAEQKRISILSPIARALIGKEKGDVVEVRAPGGTVEYEILNVRYI